MTKMTSENVQYKHTLCENLSIQMTVFSMSWLQESSYEPAPHTLPPDLPSELEVVLLTVHMSSNGEMVAHRSSSSKSVDMGGSI